MALSFVRCCVLAGLLSLASAQDIKGPPQINRAEAQNLVVVKLGQPVKLVCPVSSGSHLLVDWTKDGEKVDETWPGFRFGPRNMRVKSATADLSGTYVCTGITGYGTVQHEIKLVVIDPTDEQFRSPDLQVSAGNEYPSLGSRDFAVSEPKITQVFPPQSPSRKMAGGRVRFKCVATGVPEPTVKWYKDGAVVFHTGSVDTSVSGQLTVTRLTRSHSGTYECRVTSLLGQDTAHFRLDVEEPYDQKPEIVGDHPRNTTVAAGDQVSLQCRVNGRPPMHVKWLKLISPLDVDVLRNSSRAIEVVNGDRYHVLNESQPVVSRAGQYLIKLTLQRARPSDAGQYVCLGANNGGFTVRPAYLTVRPVQVYPFRDGSGSHVYLMIIIPVAVVVVLAGAAICCLCQRRKQSQLPDETKSDAAEASLMGARIVEQLAADKQRAANVNGSEASRGVPPSYSSNSNHGRRYDPLPHPTPTPSDYAYMLAPIGSCSSKLSDQSSSGQSCCSCPANGELRQPPPAHFNHHHHKHLHYVC